MAKSEDLFDLIQSMSKSEKRHFVLYANAYRKQSNLLRLYEVISRQKEYDEDKIIAHFKGEKFVKQLHVTKNLLYKAIIKSLLSFHEDSDMESTLLDLKKQVNILKVRKLYEQCSKLIEKGIRLATVHGLPLHEFQFVEAEHTIWDSGYRKREFSEIEKQEKESLKKINLRYKYRNIWDEYRVLYSQIAEPRNELESSGYTELLKNINYHKDEPYLSFDSKKNFLRLSYGVYTMTGDFQSAEVFATREVELCRANPHLLHYHRQDIISICSLMMIEMRLRKFTNMLNQFMEVHARRDFFNNGNYIQGVIELYAYYPVLIMYNITGHFRKGNAVVNHLLRAIPEYGMYIEIEAVLSLYLESSINALGSEDYGEALKWNNKVLNHEKIAEMKTHNKISRVFAIIIHYELGNLDIMEYYIRSTNRYLMNQKILLEFERELLLFFKRTADIFENKTYMKKAYEDFLLIIKKLFADKYEKRHFDVFDFISWLESKIDERPFKEIVKEKYGHLLPKNEESKIAVFMQEKAV